MQKLFVGILAMLVLFLAAVNVRLQRQGRLLEERLAAAERPLERTPTIPAELPPTTEPGAATKAVMAPVDHPTLPPVAKTNVPVLSTPALTAEPLQLAGKSLTFTLDGNNLATLVRVGGDEDLGLTPAQQKMIDELRKNQELQTATYTDLIQQIEAQTDQSIRQLLSPEQLAKYNAQHPVAGTVTTLDAVEEPKTSSGLRQGYLGISGGDAEGGGARVTQVFPNTAAAAFGLQKDDVILELNGQPVPHLTSLSEKIKESGEGLPVVLRIRRGGNEFTQNVQLGALPK